jgi:NADPH:quinone reductase-like Zn-dependent oxidoreductase
MKAIVYTEYGTPDVLQLKEVPRPAPQDHEVLIKIRAVSLNGSDREGLIGKPLYARIGGLRRPGNPILGSDIAGRVEVAGKAITMFKAGDEVFGEIPGYHGGLAEYACAPESTLMHKPVNLTFAQAAAIPQGGVIAWQAICNKGQVQPGQQVLVNGAGGSAGCFAVQLAKLSGAEVTGVDNTEKLDFMRSLGADHVIDHTRTDFTRTGKQYDLILDVIGHRSVFDYQRALKPNGTCFFVGGSVATLLQILLLGPLIRRVRSKNIRVLAVPQNAKDLMAVTELFEAGNIRPVIDREYSLSETAEAFRCLAEGRARGKIVITIP